jgi:hypothetical protein
MLGKLKDRRCFTMGLDRCVHAYRWAISIATLIVFWIKES